MSQIVIEKAVSGQPHKGKVFVAVHAQLDDVPYFAAALPLRQTDRRRLHGLHGAHHQR